MKLFLYALLLEYRDTKRLFNIFKNEKYAARRCEAEIMRNVHSIEKGLSIESPRKGFGIKKMNVMFDLADKLLELKGDTVTPALAVGAVSRYLEYHKNIGFTNDEITGIAKRCENLKNRLGITGDLLGGTVEIEKSECACDISAVEHLFNTRHSLREFSGEHIPNELVEKAVRLAQRSPSACNRQAVRVYNISREVFLNEMDALEGIGGFADGVDRFLLITGVKSAYKLAERNQFIVSAAMLAGYLSLSLHAYGIGACVIQRSLNESDNVRTFMAKHGIPDDEQVVVMLGIGMPKDKSTVPVSYRYPLDKIYKTID